MVEYQNQLQEIMLQWDELKRHNSQILKYNKTPSRNYMQEIKEGWVKLQEYQEMVEKLKQLIKNLKEERKTSNRGLGANQSRVFLDIPVHDFMRMYISDTGLEDPYEVKIDMEKKKGVSNKYFGQPSSEMVTEEFDMTTHFNGVCQCDHDKNDPDAHGVGQEKPQFLY